MRRLPALVVLLTVVAGCGGGGGGEGDPDGFVERMEAACDERDRAFNDLVQPIPDDITPEYAEAVVEGSVSIIEAYLEELRDAGSPGGDLDDEQERYVDLLQETLDEYEAAVGDPAAAERVFNQPAPQFRELEEALGLATCGTAGNGMEPAEG